MQASLQTRGTLRLSVQQLTCKGADHPRISGLVVAVIQGDCRRRLGVRLLVWGRAVPADSAAGRSKALFVYLLYTVLLLSHADHVPARTLSSSQQATQGRCNSCKTCNCILHMR